MAIYNPVTWRNLVHIPLKQRTFCGLFLLLSLLAVSSDLASAQTLNWGSPVQYSPIRVGGQNSRGGVGTAVFQGKLYIAYTDNSGNGNVWLTYQTSPTTYASPVQVTVTGPQYVQSAGNPTLAVYYDRLYIAWIDSYGGVDFTYTTDGVTFPAPQLGTCKQPTLAQDSPSMTTWGYNAEGLLIAYRTRNSTLGICTVNYVDLAGSVNEYSNFSLGESPGAGSFNSKIYIAYKDTTGSNYIYLAESTDGVNFTGATGATGNHTSSAASVVEYRGVLYIGYRQNSDGDRFYYTYSTDGASFSSPIVVHWTMGGPPALIVGPDSKLYNIFRQNDSGHYLYTASAQ